MERIELIDYLKGYAIILVVLGHVIVFSNPTEFTQSQLFTFVYSFHMPLLLFLSGYLVCQKPIGSKIEFIFKKCKGLILPYLTWLFISILIANSFVFDNTVINYMISHLIVYDNIWFLPVLFISFIILLAYIACNNFLKPYKLGFAALMTFGVMYLIAWSVEPPVQGLYLIRWFSPFVLIGYIVAENKSYVLKKPLFPLAAITFALLLSSWNKYVIYFSNANCYDLVVDFILALAGILLAYCLVKSLHINCVSKFLKICGIYSLEIYLISNILALLTIQIVHVQLWVGSGLLAYLTGTVAFLSISLIFSVILSYNKYISVLLFGRWSFKNIALSHSLRRVIKSLSLKFFGNVTKVL